MQPLVFNAILTMVFNIFEWLSIPLVLRLQRYYYRCVATNPVAW